METGVSEAQGEEMSDTRAFIKKLYFLFILKSSPLFDKKWYLEQYPDVRQYARDAALHYLVHGWQEGRQPSEFFDGVGYLNRYPDVRDSGLNPLVHYELYGKKEGRMYSFISAAVEDSGRLANLMEFLRRQFFPHLVLREGRFVTSFPFTSRQRPVNEQPFFSVILPTHDRGFCVENAINSCLNQTYKDFELIICDDNSSDGTSEYLAKRYVAEIEAGRIKLLANAPKQGCAAARNTALAAANGDWIAYLDSDNIMRPKALEVFAAAIIRNRRRRMFYACIRSIRSPKIFGRKFDMDQLLRKNYIDLGVFVHHREMYEKYGGFDEGMKRLLDWELIIRYVQHGTPYFIPRILLDYNDSEDFQRITTMEDREFAKRQLRAKYPELFIRIVPSIDREKVYKKIMASSKCGISRKHGDNPLLIVSLASYPDRMKYIHFTVHSLLSQTHKPDAVILWLTKSQFPGLENDLPQDLLRLRSRGLTIRWSDQDIRSYNKLVPALREYPNAVIVTADDDNYYAPNWLSILYRSYCESPGMIHCHRTHRLLFDAEAKLLPYSKWKKNLRGPIEGWDLLFTGVGGVLYPPRALHPDVTDVEKFMELCPTTDDIWFWSMALLNDTPIRLVKNNQHQPVFVNPEGELNIRGETTLHAKNVAGYGNDIALEKVFGRFPKILRLVMPNRIVLHQMNGTITNPQTIPGLTVDFRGNGSIVRLYDPLPEFIDCSFVCGDFCTVELRGSRRRLRNMSIQAHQPGSKIVIGDGFSADGGLLLAAEQDRRIEIGRDCMFSSSVQIGTSDSPSEIDRADGNPVTPGKDIVIGDHVRLCEGASLHEGAQIASDSIVAAKSLVNTPFPEPGCLIAGSPAKVVRRGVSWSRQRSQDYTDMVRRQKNRISVAFICDDQYVIPTGTALTSLLYNRDYDTFCDIYIITANLSEESIARFKALENDNVQIQIIRANTGHLEDLHHPSARSYCVASIAALLKFELPRLLPRLDRVLYLDGDIIVRQDLYDLFATPLNTFCACAVKDSGQIYSRNRMRTSIPGYFNSGVMLMNLKAMREEGMPDRLIEAKRVSDNSQLMDQDVFNQVLRDRVGLLDIKYNFLYINLLRAIGKFTMEKLNRAFGSTYKDLEDINRQAFIVHFASKDKPWKYNNVALVNEWDSYFRLSPFGDRELHRVGLESNMYKYNPTFPIN